MLPHFDPEGQKYEPAANGGEMEDQKINTKIFWRNFKFVTCIILLFGLPILWSFLAPQNLPKGMRTIVALALPPITLGLIALMELLFQKKDQRNKKKYYSKEHYIFQTLFFINLYTSFILLPFLWFFYAPVNYDLLTKAFIGVAIIPTTIWPTKFFLERMDDEMIGGFWETFRLVVFMIVIFTLPAAWSVSSQKSVPADLRLFIALALPPITVGVNLLIKSLFKKKGERSKNRSGSKKYGLFDVLLYIHIYASLIVLPVLWIFFAPAKLDMLIKALIGIMVVPLTFWPARFILDRV